MERHAVADAVPGKAGQGQGPGEEVGRPEVADRQASVLLRDLF